MEVTEFRQDYIQDVKMTAALENEGTVSTFVSMVLDNLLDLNVITDYEQCYATGKNGRKNYRVDAYSYDEFDFSMSLFVADYSGEDEIETLTRTEANSLFDRIEAFIDGCINGKLKYELEISTPAYDLAERLYGLRNIIRKFRVFIVTDKAMSERITTLGNDKLCGIPVEYNIWDINRIFKIVTSGLEDDHVKIEMKDFGSNGLPCLEASDLSSTSVKCYLSVIPAGIIADLYDRFGSRLLEGNVRSFLSTKGSINKNIRKTIIEANGEDKRMFFSYNNGISATASKVTVEEGQNGKLLTVIENLQIVNGGQTTASLSTARFKDKANLDGIYVQMKLTVIPNEQQAQSLIPKISRYSNSQNKVSDADFFSNHEFNVQIEKMSRRMYAHSKDGQQYETHWFFERSRGQYEQEQSRMSKKEKEVFKKTNPKDQLITKTDIAKYQNIWLEQPHVVSLGAQKNFSRFAAYIVDKWDKDNSVFNEQYYRDMVAVAIMFKNLDKKIPKQEWYENGYKANVVAYTLSYLHYLVKTKYNGSEINLQKIWETQVLPDKLENELINMAGFVFRHITSDDRQIENVTEWCKKDTCWNLLKDKEYVFCNDPESYLISKEEKTEQKIAGRKEHVLTSGIFIQAEVVQKGSEYWKKAIEFGIKKHLLSETEISFLKSATKIEFGKLPTDNQCKKIVNIEAKLLDEGFAG